MIPDKETVPAPQKQQKPSGLVSWIFLKTFFYSFYPPLAVISTGREKSILAAG
jgi:hypothetical protein